MATKVVFITSGTTFTVPADFSSFISVEVIGGGGGSWRGITAGGSGGGAYSKSTSVTGLAANGTAWVSIGAGGAAGTTAGNGGDTWFNAASNAAPTLTSQGALAKGGTAASSTSGAAGGASASGVGDTKFSGGQGGTSTGTSAKAGGGGAGGPGGAGGTGGGGDGTVNGTAVGGGGGSGATASAAGTNGSVGTVGTVGGAGGASAGQTGGSGATSTTSATSGSTGGGAGGGYGNTNPFCRGAAGSAGSVWTATAGGTAGPGGGGGGSVAGGVDSVGGAGGAYGGGAGGSGASSTVAASGGDGLIVFTYDSAAAVAINPGVGTVSITGYAPTITSSLSPGVGSMSITGYAPTLTQGTGTFVDPAVGSITITGYAPTIGQSLSINPGVGNLTITGYAPSISQNVTGFISPGTGSLVITGYAPLVYQSPLLGSQVNPQVVPNQILLPQQTGGVPTTFTLAQSGTRVSLTGTTSTTVLASFIVPGGLLSVNDGLRVSALFSCTSSANVKTFEVYCGSVAAGNKMSTTTVTNQTATETLTVWQNRNSTSSQTAILYPYYGEVASTGNIAATAQDTTQDFVVYIVGKLSDATESISLHGYSAEVVRTENTNVTQDVALIKWNPNRILVPGSNKLQGATYATAFTYDQEVANASVTATLAKTAFFSIPLPAYMVGPNDVIQVTAYFSGNGTHNKTATIAYGGVDYGTVTAVDGLKIQTFIRQKNSTSSQAASALGPVSGLSTLNTGWVNVTTDQSITFYGTLTDGGETLTLLYYNIQIRRVFDTTANVTYSPNQILAPFYNYPGAVDWSTVYSIVDYGAPVSASSTTAERTLGSALIPASTLTGNNALFVSYTFSGQSSGNAKTYRVKLGGQTVSSTTVNTTDLSNNFVMIQSMGNAMQATGTNVTTVDMTQDQILTLTAEMASGAETVTLQSWRVESWRA